MKCLVLPLLDFGLEEDYGLFGESKLVVYSGHNLLEKMDNGGCLVWYILFLLFCENFAIFLTVCVSDVLEEEYRISFL